MKARKKAESGKALTAQSPSGSPRRPRCIGEADVPRKPPGVFLTGSDTSSNALFAALQATAAQQIGVSDILLVAANTTGGVTGKMISPQSIAIACAAVGLVGKESDLFRFTVKHSLIFTCMVGLITTLQAYVLTWMIP